MLHIRKSDSQGGQITGAEGILTLKAGESRTLNVKAEQGYVIDSLVVGGKYQQITDSKSMTVKAAYGELSDGDIIEAQFVAESVRQKEEQRGESVVMPTPVPAKVTLDKSSVEDSGNYTVVATVAAGAASTDSESAACRVIVKTQQTQQQIPDLAQVTGLKAASVGTDKVTLKWKNVAGAEGYEVFRYDVSKKKFIKAGTSAGVSFTDKKCSAGKPYRYKVKAYAAINGKTYYGSLSSELKVLTKPKAPARVSAERLTEAAVQISFQPVSGAVSYEIYKYDKGNKKYKPAYKVKGKKLYQYNSKKKNWTYLRRIKKASGKKTARLTGMNQEESNQKYYIKAFVSKRGYASRYSAKSKVVKVK